MQLIQQSFFKFLERFSKEGGPFLLALSGGPDSMALFYLLCEASFPFEVAHVNHGWRKESEQEAAILLELCKEKNRVFHLKTLRFDENEGNLEDKARNSRYAFFKELCESRKFQGVLLGHHADDQAETVLKRVFEGANLYHLKGLGQETLLNGIFLFRPLLNLRKKELLAYLEAGGYSYFLDHTNEDEKFLRGRFRKELFPSLSKTFGKEITSSLCRLGHHAAELHEFLESYLMEYRGKVLRKGVHVSLNLGTASFKTEFEWKAVVRDFFENEGVSLSTSVLETIVGHLKKKSPKKEIRLSSKRVEIERGIVTLFE